MTQAARRSQVLWTDYRSRFNLRSATAVMKRALRDAGQLSGRGSVDWMLQLEQCASVE